MITSATRFLIMSLSQPKTKTSTETKARAKAGLCLGFVSDGVRCDKPAHKCGNCTSCYDKIYNRTRRMDAQAKMKFLTNLRKLGAYLWPYEVKEFKADDDIYHRAAQ